MTTEWCPTNQHTHDNTRAITVTHTHCDIHSDSLYKATIRVFRLFKPQKHHGSTPPPPKVRKHVVAVPRKDKGVLAQKGGLKRALEEGGGGAAEEVYPNIYVTKKFDSSH